MTDGGRDKIPAVPVLIMRQRQAILMSCVTHGVAMPAERIPKCQVTYECCGVSRA